jgi:hypothetical protein
VAVVLVAKAQQTYTQLAQVVLVEVVEPAP